MSIRRDPSQRKPWIDGLIVPPVRRFVIATASSLGCADLGSPSRLSPSIRWPRGCDVLPSCPFDCRFRSGPLWRGWSGGADRRHSAVSRFAIDRVSSADSRSFQMQQEKARRGDGTQIAWVGAPTAAGSLPSSTCGCSDPDGRLDGRPGSAASVEIHQQPHCYGRQLQIGEQLR